MGARPSSQFGYANSIPLIFHPELSIKYEVISSIIGLKLGESMNIGYTAPISQLEAAFPEFIFTQIRYDLYKVTRALYLGDSNRCCITSEEYFISSNRYITCPPALQSPKTTRSCDFTLSNYCFDAPTNISVCSDWFDGYIQENGYDQYTVLGYDKCATVEQRNSNKFCEVYLTFMRQNPDSTLHDAFLDRIRDSTFRCSYPLSLAKSITLPRVCWDRNCITTPSWKLKYKDYITRSTCPLTYSNITFTVTGNGSINVQSPSNQILNFKTVLPNENIYTEELKSVGKGYIDFLSLEVMIIISILLTFVFEDN